MAYKGVILEESLEDKTLLELIKIVSTDIENLENEDRVMTFHKFELDESKKDEFLEKAKQTIKEAFYTHIAKENELIVIFKDKIFYCKTQEQMNEAREYGKSRGILEVQMPFEKLIKDPFA